MDSTGEIVDCLARVDFSQLPHEAVAAAKEDILDTLGTIVGGSARPGCPAVVELAREWGGKPEATVLVYGDRLPANLAALANACMGHALDYDDTFDMTTPLHAGVSVLPASFAVAERIGGVSGAELITAVTAGVELMCRLSRASTGGLQGWHLTSVYGFLGSALAAGKLLGLSAEQLSNALGIAYAQASGNLRCVDEGALTKRFQAGIAAQGGVLSALLAERGFTGAKAILESEHGLFEVYHHGIFDAQPLTADLGAKFDIANLSFKPWPCCRYTHSYITATLALVKEHGITANDVETVVVGPPVLCEPWDIKRRPRTFVDAQFSVPYTVAVAIARGKVTIGDFTDEAIRDEVVLGLTSKVTARDLPEVMAGFSKRITPALVEIHTTDGSRLSRWVEHAYGHPQNRMSTPDLANKFRDCAAWAGRTLEPQAVEEVITSVQNLERIADVRILSKLLAARG